MANIKIFFIVLSLITSYFTFYKFSHNTFSHNTFSYNNTSHNHNITNSNNSDLLHHHNINKNHPLSQVKTITLLKQNLLPQTGKIVHSVSLTNVGSDGELLALWFSGDAEAGPDVQIWQSYYSNGHWTKPVIAVNKINAYHYLIRTFGNPVVYQQGQDLHLLAVTSIGGWALSKIDHFISKDQGQSWQEQGLLSASPFFNLSTLGHNPPLLQNDRIYLPVYHECLKQYAEILVMDPQLRLLDLIKIPDSLGLIQPALIKADNTIIGLLRNVKSRRGNQLYYINSDDNFRPQQTNLQNFNSAVSLTKLTDNQYLLVYNEGRGRNHLKIAVSSDLLFWKNIYTLEDTDQQEEFSYPATLIVNDILHIMYTYKHTNIKHVMLKLHIN